MTAVTRLQAASPPALSPSTYTSPGLHLLTGPNGGGKSWAARELAAQIAGAQLLSAESQQAFYEAQLAADESNFQEELDTGTTVAELLGDAGRQHTLFGAFRLEALWRRGYRLLSTGEARKVLLLRALLQAPTLVVLDEPFEGLDAQSCTELTSALTSAAAHLPVVLVGAFAPNQLPFPDEAVAGVTLIERRKVAFLGSLTAWREQRAAQVAARRSPPVDLGSYYEPLPPNVPLVQLTRGRVQYGDDVVFADLDFTIRPGQHTLIEGPNGSGKSTLVEMISGDHPQAYSNDLYLFGRKRGTGETVWDIKKNVGIVSGRLHRDYRVDGSIEDVLVSGLYDSIGVYQEREPSERARALAWLEWLELGLTPSASFRGLSFGQQRLVLIARAAIKVPPLVVMDEPTAGLDPDNRARVLDLIASLCTQKRSTVVFVTHRADERAFWQERIGGARLTLQSRNF
ncbi:MAG TPA: ATP-binding cassette domain-containing protein [Polyangiaceae bacterium]|nr:ATP-binding cassette domain-containing protein [Polyangiaceae bacterium]